MLTPHHSLELDLGWTQQGKRCDHGLQMPIEAEHQTSVGVQTLLASARPSFGAKTPAQEEGKTTLKGNRAS